MPRVLTDEQKQEVERIMDLALDWLMTWDIVEEKRIPAPERERTAARLSLKESVIDLVCKAMPAKAANQAANRQEPDAPGAARLTLGALRSLTNRMPDESEIDLGDTADCIGLAWGGSTPARACPDDDAVVEPPRISLLPEWS